MAREQFFNGDKTFTWIDIVDPTLSELQTVAREYNIHNTSVQDCLEPYHLPKYEVLGDHRFMIIRVIDEAAPDTASTIVDLTRKIAVFTGPGYLLTVHRKEISFLKTLKKKWSSRLLTYAGEPRNHLFLDFLSESFETFDRELDKEDAVLEDLELTVFDLQSKQYDFHALYRLKRRASVCRRILRLSYELVLHFAAGADAKSSIYVQDLKDDLQNTLTYADDLIEGLNQLVTTHHSIESQKANEVMRILALFSAFFFPLTLIVGIYGMNFKFMPEIEWELGYPFVITLMIVTTAGIYFWFKRKKWL